LRLINRTGASKTAGGLSFPDIQDNSTKGLAEIRIPFLFRIAIKYKNIATSREIQRTSENDTNNIQTGRLNPFLCRRIKRLCWKPWTASSGIRTSGSFGIMDYHPVAL
jgi:hypothetical protein